MINIFWKIFYFTRFSKFYLSIMMTLIKICNYPRNKNSEKIDFSIFLVSRKFCT